MPSSENSVTSNNEQLVLSHHNIFWVKRDGSRVLVCHAGDLLAQAKLTRFPKLDFENCVDEARLEKISSTFLDLKSVLRPKLKMQAVARVRSNWGEWFHSANSCSVLELVLISEILFPELMRAHAATWSQASMPLFHRSCFIATMSALGACALGYASWSYLENIWRVSFAHSVEFAHKGMELSTLGEFEATRVKSEKSSCDLSHIETEYPSLEAVAKIVFERANGEGGPRGLHMAEMTDVERWFAHLQLHTPWTNEFLKNESGWFKSFWSDDEFNIVAKFVDGKPREFISRSDEEYLDFGL